MTTQAEAEILGTRALFHRPIGEDENNRCDLFRRGQLAAPASLKGNDVPTISQFFGIVIQMFWREHSPPHFHALYGDFEALIDIRTLEVIGGRLPKRAFNLVAEWAIEHRAELMEDWNLCQSKQTPRKIPPLE